MSACMSVSICGTAQSKPLCSSQINALMTNMKSDLAATSLELSCDPDEGEPSSKDEKSGKEIKEWSKGISGFFFQATSLSDEGHNVPRVQRDGSSGNGDD